MLPDVRCGHLLDELHNSAAKLGFPSLVESSQSAAGLTNKAVMEVSFPEKKDAVPVGASNDADVFVLGAWTPSKSDSADLEPQPLRSPTKNDPDDKDKLEQVALCGHRKTL